MPQLKRQMKLGAMVSPTGHHPASWRRPDAQADAGSNFEHYKQLVMTAERGKLDFAFLADFLCVPEGPPDVVSRSALYTIQFEPMTLMSALAAVTTHLGVVVTASASYQPAYTVARQFASLDLFSGGRAAWNVVTSSQDGEAKNYGLDHHLGHAERYERAREYVEVVCKLWASVEPDAILCDKASGRFFDPAKVHAVDHKGKHLSVRGPLNVAHSPQGRPVLVQAGSSEAGRDLAASMAEIIFTQQNVLADSQAFSRDVRERMARFGRPPQSALIMPGLVAVVGRSQAEAEDKLDALNSMLDADACVQFLQNILGEFDLSGYSLDDPMPVVPFDGSLGSRSGIELVNHMVETRKFTVRQLAQAISAGVAHLKVFGTPQQIADVMEEWFVSGACDGFNLAPLVYPTDLAEFVDLVIPELQRRGLFRREYEGRTLRENLGLPFPAVPAGAHSLQQCRGEGL